MAESDFGSSQEELDKIFDMNAEKREKIADIRGRIGMPNPDKPGDAVNVRVLYYKKGDENDLFKKVSGEKFTNTAVFLNVEEVEQPGIEKDLGLSKTLYQGIDRELTNRGLAWKDLPGKILTMTADYWTSAPIIKRGNRTCPKCSGAGCAFCTVSGNGDDAGSKTGYAPPTRYDAVIRDNMAGINQGKSEGGPVEF